MLLMVVSISLRKAASHQSYSSWWLYITSCISFHVASASEQRQHVMASCSASVMSSHRIAELAAIWVEHPRVSVSCTVPWMELQCMASSPDSTLNSLASLMLSAWHSDARLKMLLAWSMVSCGVDGSGGEYAGRPGARHVVGSSYAGYRGSRAPESDGRIAREVEVQAGEEWSRRVPAVSQGGTPMSRTGLAQGSRSDGGWWWLNHVAEETCCTAEANKHAGADREGSVDHARVLHVKISSFASGWPCGGRGWTATLARVAGLWRLHLVVRGWPLRAGGFLGGSRIWVL